MIKIFGAYPWTKDAFNKKGGAKEKNKFSPLAIKELINHVQKRLEKYQLNHQEIECPKLFYSRLRATSGSFLLSSLRERMKTAYAVIFDITDKNPNVMLELGIALELQQNLEHSAKVFLIACAREYSDSLLPSDIRGYFLTTYKIDEKTNKVTFCDGGSLVMRIVSDILEQKQVAYIENIEDEK